MEVETDKANCNSKTKFNSENFEFILKQKTDFSLIFFISISSHTNPGWGANSFI